MKKIGIKKAWHQKFKQSPKSLRTASDGRVLDSKLECKRYEQLKAQMLSGDITDLRCQVSVPLTFNRKSQNPRSIKTPTGRIAHYTADFVYKREGVQVIEDVKGSMMDKTATLRIAIFECAYNKKVTIWPQRKPKKKKIKKGA